MESSNTAPVPSGRRLSAPACASLVILVAAGLALLNSLLHAHIYGVRNYRDDEIVVVHISNLFTATELVQHLARDTHPPGWQLLAELWIEALGINEEVTRWLSKLVNLLTFALVFQFGKHLGGRRVGLFAVALLGVYGFASIQMYELRPYSALVLLVTALNLLFYRWLRKPTPRLMVLYSLVGIAALYTHYFSLFVFSAHAVCLLLLTPPHRKHWLNSFLMWVFIGASFLAWLLPLIHALVGVAPRIWYYKPPSSWDAWLDFFTHTSFRPAIIYYLLVLLSMLSLAGLSLPDAKWTNGTAGRARSRRALLYVLLLIVTIIVVAFVASNFVSAWSSRNLVILTPLVAIAMAMGLRTLPTVAGIALIVLLYLHVPPNTDIETNNGPFREMVQEMRPSYETDSIVVTEIEWAWYRLLPVAYYLMEFTPDQMANERMFHTVSLDDSALPPTYPERFKNVLQPFRADDLERQLPTHSQLWHVQTGRGNQYRDELQAWLDGHYAQIRTVKWDQGFPTSYRLSEYARVPANDGPILEVGDSLRLYAWELLSAWEVSPCQAVTIESWWQIRELDATPYTFSLILADQDGDGQLAIANSVPADQFTSDWIPNRYYRDHTNIDIPCDIGTGSYDLLLAAKESMTGETLLLAYPGGGDIGREYYLTTLNVARR